MVKIYEKREEREGKGEKGNHSFYPGKKEHQGPSRIFITLPCIDMV